MPHCVILYTPNLERKADITALCRAVADAMLTIRDENGKQVFPTAGTRVLAYRAAHHAVADGSADCAFVYVNVRMALGRTEAVKKHAGDCLLGVVKSHFAPIFDRDPVGITLQIDESTGQVYDGKHSNLHALFNKS